MIWNGLLLNERSIYQLESLECRERLQQIHHEIIDLAPTATINNDDSEYLQELEGQVIYWKKEAKKYQRYSDGYKDQCKDDLQNLLQKVVSSQ